MTSNLRSARANTLARCGSGMPSKSRKGWKVTISSPRSPIIRRTSAGVPLKERRSFSKISTPLKLAAAMASSFSGSVPLRQTVAIAVLHGLQIRLMRGDGIGGRRRPQTPPAALRKAQRAARAFSISA